jgi:hypothetical protein
MTRGRYPAKLLVSLHCNSCGEVFSSKKGDQQFCSRVCYYEARKLNSERFVSEAFKQAGKTTDKAYMQTEAYKNTKRRPNTAPYRRFYNAVKMASEKVYQQHKSEINPQNHPRTLCGVNGGYQLDHIKPVSVCFAEGMTVLNTADKSNLQLLAWKENLLKGNKHDPV